MAARGIRNNNPGNIEYGPFARSMGAIGSDGRFAIFPDAETGIRAIAALQRSYEKRGLFSPEARIGRWAPSSENDTGAYAGAVAKGMGISSRTPFSFIDENKADDAAFIKAMIGVENGRNPYADTMIASALGFDGILPANPTPVDWMPGPGGAPIHSPSAAPVAPVTPASPSPTPLRSFFERAFASLPKSADTKKDRLTALFADASMSAPQSVQFAPLIKRGPAQIGMTPQQSLQPYGIRALMQG